MNIDLIEKPFDRDDLQHKPGPYGKLLTYIATPAYIRRMNQVFEYSWSMDVRKLEFQQDEIVAIVQVVGDGITKTQAGGKKITRDAEGSALCLGDDAKSAISAGFKKACQQFGIGLYLAETDDAPTSNVQPEKATSMTNGGVTESQLSYIKKLRSDLGWPTDKVCELAERMFHTDDILALNKTQASALISALKKEAEGDDEPY
jgi:hypothetical protein